MVSHTRAERADLRLCELLLDHGAHAVNDNPLAALLSADAFNQETYMAIVDRLLQTGSEITDLLRELCKAKGYDQILQLTATNSN